MQDTRKEQLLKFCQSLGIEMHKLELLNSALTHTSYAHESKELPRPEHNERVEFLGDSVLSVIVSTYMYCTFPNLKENLPSSGPISSAKHLWLNMPVK